MLRFLFLLILMPSTAFADLTKADIDFVEKGVCKVISSTGMGTGFFYKETQDKYYIMTNAHVINHSNTFKIRLYESGYKAKLIPAAFLGVWYRENTSTDIGVLSVQKSLIKTSVNLLEFHSNLTLSKHDLIFGWGFPNGKAACFWTSRVIKSGKNIIQGTFPFISGQSGGPILSLINSKPYVVGIATWRFGENESDENGAGVASDHIIKLLSKERTQTEYLTKNYKKVSLKRCDICGLTKEDHYIKNGNKTEFYCPYSLQLQCNPQGNYPPRHSYQGQPYSRWGEFYLGIGKRRPQPNRPETAPKHGDVSPDDDNFWLDRPAPEVSPSPSVVPEVPLVVPEAPPVPPISTIPIESKPKVEKTSWIKGILGNVNLLNLGLLGLSFATGGLTVPALGARLGMRPLFARIIGLVVQKKLKKIVEKIKPTETEYFDKEDLTTPLKKK